MFADDHVIYYYDQLSESYKEVTKVETPRTAGDGVTVINIYIQKKSPEKSELFW